jgi:hypothetical protein
MILQYVYDKYFTIRFSDKSEWKDGLWANRKGGLIWYTDGSKASIGNGAVVCAVMAQGKNIILALNSTHMDTIRHAWLRI